MSTGCADFEYTAGETTACRKLKLIRNDLNEGNAEELEAMLKCVAAVCKRLESIDVFLDEHNDPTDPDDFFSFVNELAIRYAQIIRSVALGCTTTVRANFYLNYFESLFDPQSAVNFVDHFKAAYPVVSAGAEETEEPTYCSLDRTMDLGAERSLRLSVSMVALDDEELAEMMDEQDNLDHDSEDGEEEEEEEEQ
ncbi:hypothetical protein AAVH_18922 [Aphelenchoides avenae]|nr:hypothetical protein AAVH_18922 [Aphelenchus avenae]